VRQALNLAYDRQGWYEFKNVSSLGAGLTYSGIYPSDRPYGHTEAEVLTWPGINPNTKEADIKAANDLLDEVFGVGKRFKASLEPSNQANYIDIALYTADQLGKDLGIEFSIMVNEPAVSRERGLSGVKSLGPGTAGVATWFGDPDDALLRWHSDYMSPTGLKNAGPAFADAEARFASMHADMLTQRTIMDIDKRRALTRSIVEEAHDLAVNLQLGWNVLFYGEVPALGGFIVPDFGVVIGMGLYERLWLTGKTRYE
jgi:ABC-type transport system substrate-binding protein